MKKFLSVLTISIFYVSLSCSQSLQSDNRNNIDGLAIRFEETEHDYGNIAEGGDGTYEFIFQNIGSEPLLLNNVRSSCGCTVPEWSKEPIPAGETGIIKVSYNTRITGSFSKSITVYTSADEKPVVLVIKGNVKEAAD
ncbi:MAG: DUF1573 domain-containing protein [Bacteroidales bacterium]|nr:DUF1573 domain-containing protein [Bacteroidales bacterium]